MFICRSGLTSHNYVEDFNRSVDFFCRKCSECLYHSQPEIVLQRQFATALDRNFSKEIVKKVIVTVAHIDPLSDQQE